LASVLINIPIEACIATAVGGADRCTVAVRLASTVDLTRRNIGVPISVAVAVALGLIVVGAIRVRVSRAVDPALFVSAVPGVG